MIFIIGCFRGGLIAVLKVRTRINGHLPYAAKFNVDSVDCTTDFHLFLIVVLYLFERQTAKPIYAKIYITQIKCFVLLKGENECAV